MARTRGYVVEEPALAKLFFANTKMGWLWLPFRLYLGWMWLSSGSHKFVDPKWMEGGAALMSYWQRAIKLDPRPVAAYDWYRSFLQFLLDGEAYTWFSKIIVFGELAVGIALILGAFTGIAAFFGGFMNWNFIMAGTASTNGMLFAIATWLVLGWRNAGAIGLDRWLLPWLGTPWQPGYVWSREDAPARRGGASG